MGDIDLYQEVLPFFVNLKHLKIVACRFDTIKSISLEVLDINHFNKPLETPNLRYLFSMDDRYHFHDIGAKVFDNLSNLEYLALYTIPSFLDIVLEKLKKLKYLHVRYLRLDVLNSNLITKIMKFEFDFDQIVSNPYGQNNCKKHIDNHPNWISLCSKKSYTYYQNNQYKTMPRFFATDRGITPDDWLSKNGYFTEEKYSYGL